MTATLTPRGKRATRSKAIVAATSRDFEEKFRNPDREDYVLRLYITGTSPRSCLAVANIRSICEEFLPGRYDLDVIDIYQQPEEALDQQIVAAPTLVKKFPLPSRRMVGDLSNRDRVTAALNLDREKMKPVNP